ncbi:hypothetical protein LSCM1_01351 [Leishmania martiniquensis]|uniref:Uncharacterized protein n=1 Tax=Leishmania martiniquensis TaxID=1580590 RepID=A0A836KMK3_9TRYP|nr:hypothetical protein LSCM1_01351 [Leishmania martiniquensis]
MPSARDASAHSRWEASPLSITDPTKAAPSLSEVQNANPATAATKASRRAQGWHSAVGGGAPPGAVGASHSNLDAKALGVGDPNSIIAATSSVHYRRSDVSDQGSPRPSTSRHGAARDYAVDFRQNMADFLTVMYGDKTVRGVVGSDGSEGAHPADGKVGPGESGIPVEPLAARRGPPPPTASSCGVPPRAKGPLTKRRPSLSGHRSQSDHIGTLVESLARAYSRRATSTRGEFQAATGTDDDHPITYSGTRQSSTCRATASPHLSHGNGVGTGCGHDSDEVSVFVSQAMGNILGPGGLRGQGAVSNLSLLSSLGLDKNFFNLMHFPTQSSMQHVTGEEDSDTMLVPMHVGEQAMFRSVGTRPNMNDISVSKSMRGVLSSSPHRCEKDVHLNNTLAPMRDSSEDPRQASRPLPPSSQRQALVHDKHTVDANAVMKTGVNQRGGSGSVGNAERPRVELCLSLDSKALGLAGGANDEDDSWGDAPASALAAVAVGGGSPAIVPSARSVLDCSRAPPNLTLQKALGALQDEEQLKRDVVMAVEHQLRGYIASLEQEERSKKSGGPADISGRREWGGEASASSPTATGSATVTPKVGGAGAVPRGCAALNSDVAPLMQNVIDFFQESTT